jgi:hypothetical protein
MAGEKKPKKPMTEEQLERLALARQKANEMRKINQAKRLQNKMDNLKYNPDGTLKEETATHAENIEEGGTAPHAENKGVESNDRVVFVKRVTKKKEPIVQPTPPPPEIPKPQPPPPARKTKHELMYDNMFSGGFLNNQFGRRF